MRRPQNLVLLVALLTLSQNDARAQPKLPMIGFMGQGTASAEGQRAAAFVQRLRELGWIEGQNVAIEFRWAEGRSERSAAIASEFVKLKVDVAPSRVSCRSSSRLRLSSWSMQPRLRHSA